jgi:hypothetical protein
MWGDINYSELSARDKEAFRQYAGVTEEDLLNHSDPDAYFSTRIDHAYTQSLHEVAWEDARAMAERDILENGGDLMHSGQPKWDRFQRLVPMDQEGYFEIGVMHPEYQGEYRHYSGAPKGTIGHVRGTLTEEPTIITGGVEVPNNTYVIEEIQSDAQQSSAQKGPLRQVHGVLFKSAVQDAIEKGADRIYLPTSEAIVRPITGDRGEKSLDLYKRIYDKEVKQQGLDELASIPGVEVRPVSGLKPGTDDEVQYYYEIEMSPEAKDYLTKGEGFKTPGYAAGGLVASDYDEEQIDRMSDEIFNFGLGGVVKAAGKAAGKMLAESAEKKAYEEAKATKSLTPKIEAPTIIVPKRGKIKDIQENVRKQRGDYAARRVERAADEVPNLEHQYTQRALEKEFTASNPQALMVLNPKDFEEFAHPLSPTLIGRTENYGGFNVPEDMSYDQYIEYLASIARDQGLSDVPYLRINETPEGELFISGHEGRHRTRALTKLGDESTLISLDPSYSLTPSEARRYKEDYVDALNARFGLDRLITPEYRPEVKGEVKRSPIIMPDLFAKGGKVSAEPRENEYVTKAARYGRKGQYQMANLIGIKPEVEFATVIPERYYPANEQHNARGDAMRHMLLQAQLMQKYGETPAKIIGWMHENLSGPQGDAEKAMDEYNDRLGREIGRVAKDKADMAYRAMQAIDKQQAKTLTKEQMGEGYAEGGLVYNDEEINNLADQLLGA